MQSIRHDEAFMPYTQVPHTWHRSQIIQIFPLVVNDEEWGKSSGNWGKNQAKFTYNLNIYPQQTPFYFVCSSINRSSLNYPQCQPETLAYCHFVALDLHLLTLWL